MSDVSGVNNQVGGLVGRLDQGLVENAFARGDVSGNNRVGGLIGELLSGEIRNTFSTGKIDSNSSTYGGLIGHNQQGSSSNSFWDTETSGTEVGYGSTTGSSMDGVTGLPTEEMLEALTFTEADWNFDDIWMIDPDGEINDGYPYLEQAGFPGLRPIFYSRKDGDWEDDDTWSTDGHDGDAAEVPGPNDEARIGADHTVTLSKNVTVAQGLVRVMDTGTLDAGTHRLQAAGTFQLEAGGTLITADPDGITSSGNEGSITTNTRHFDEAANYVYNSSEAQVTGDGLPGTVNNLRIDNTNGVSRFGSLTVNGQLQLDNGTFTMSTGASLVTYDVVEDNGNIRMQLTIEGDKGWRMLTSRCKPLTATCSTAS